MWKLTKDGDMTFVRFTNRERGEYQAQLVLMLLRLQKGTWFLDRDLGVDLAGVRAGLYSDEAIGGLFSREINKLNIDIVSVNYLKDENAKLNRIGVTINSE